MIISSTANPVVKNFRKLKDRKYRYETLQFLVEGTRIVKEALDENSQIETLIYSSELIRTQIAREIVVEAINKGIINIEVTSDVFKSLSSKDGPQGIAAIIKIKENDIHSLGENPKGVWVALYQIADPGNLGTILRTLDGMGGKGVILIGDSTDPYDQSSVRASMGAIFSQKIIKTNQIDFLNYVQTHNVKLIGTSDKGSTEFRNHQFDKDTILLMGSEREGLPESLREKCNATLSIPMLGKGDSLNVSVAASIILYEIQRQLSKKL